MRPLVFDSTELRWFEPGRAPFDPVALDLGHGAPPAILDERADVYCVSEDEAIGVKVRGDAGSPKLEVKTRLASDPCKVGDARGLLESWRKWSWAGPEWDPSASPAGGGSGRVSLDGPWLTVEKRRGLWRFEWRDDSIRFLLDSRMVEQGGAMEVTALSVEGLDAWTYGVEAFGHGPESGEIVRAAARILLDATGRGSAVASNSYGYPRWLTTILQRGDS